MNILVCNGVLRKQFIKSEKSEKSSLEQSLKLDVIKDHHLMQ
jgi:hypothetical protein